MIKSTESLLLDLGYKERKKLFSNLSDWYLFRAYRSHLFDRKLLRLGEKLTVSFTDYDSRSTTREEYFNKDKRCDFVTINLYPCLQNLYKFSLHNCKDFFIDSFKLYIKNNEANYTKYRTSYDLIKEERKNIRYFILDYYLKDRVKITLNEEDITHYLFALK